MKTLKNKIDMTILLIVMAFSITACAGKESDKDTEAAAADSLDTMDVENLTSVSLQLTDNLYVEAEVTPYSVYKDGISAYYLSWSGDGSYGEDDETETEDAGSTELELENEIIASLDDFIEGQTENTTDNDPDAAYKRTSLDGLSGLYGRSLDTQLSILEEYFGCALDTENMLLYVYEEENSIFDYTLYFDSEDNYENFLQSQTAGYGSIQCMRPGYDSNDWSELFHNALSYSVKWLDMNVEKASESVQESFESTRILMTELTGLEFDAQASLCIPLNDSDYAYAFVYLPIQDNLPIIYAQAGKSFSIDILSDNIRHKLGDAYSGSAYNAYGNALWVYYLDGELVGMESHIDMKAGDLYKESEPIADVKTVLENAKEHFELQDLSHDYTITDIRLAYNTWFSDEEDGEIQNILSPFWYLFYYDGYNIETKANRIMLFDAYTGEYVGDAALRDVVTY